MESLCSSEIPSHDHASLIRAGASSRLASAYALPIPEPSTQVEAWYAVTLKSSAPRSTIRHPFLVARPMHDKRSRFPFSCRYLPISEQDIPAVSFRLPRQMRRSLKLGFLRPLKESDRLHPMSSPSFPSVRVEEGPQRSRDF